MQLRVFFFTRERTVRNKSQGKVVGIPPKNGLLSPMLWTLCEVPEKCFIMLAGCICVVFHPSTSCYKNQWLSNEQQPDMSDITGIAFDRTLFFLPGNEWLLEGQDVTGNIRHLSKSIPIVSSIPASPLSPNPTLTLDAWIYCCLSEGGACMMKAVSFRQPLLIGSTPHDGSITVTLEHAF